MKLQDAKAYSYGSEKPVRKARRAFVLEKLRSSVTPPWAIWHSSENEVLIWYKSAGMAANDCNCLRYENMKTSPRSINSFNTCTNRRILGGYHTVLSLAVKMRSKFIFSVYWSQPKVQPWIMINTIDVYNQRLFDGHCSKIWTKTSVGRYIRRGTKSFLWKQKYFIDFVLGSFAKAEDFYQRCTRFLKFSDVILPLIWS